MFLIVRLLIVSGVILVLSCAPEFNNPYDPDGDKPLPLPPTDISLTSPESGTVLISFDYEYASNSRIKIKRKDIVIAILGSGTDFYDYWEFSEDTSMKYTLTGCNDFGNTDAPKCYFYNKVPPRITITSEIDDTVYLPDARLSGTVWDSSDVDVFSINNDTIPLSFTSEPRFYKWYYNMTLDKGKNAIDIYAKDKSPCDSDTTIELSIYYSKSEMSRKE